MFELVFFDNEAHIINIYEIDGRKYIKILIIDINVNKKQIFNEIIRFWKGCYHINVPHATPQKKGLNGGILTKESKFHRFVIKPLYWGFRFRNDKILKRI